MPEKPKKSLDEQIREKEELLRQRREREKLREEKEKQELALLKKKKQLEYQKKIDKAKYSRGGLVHIAGLLEINPNVLLGAFLEITEKINQNLEDQLVQWETAGKRYHALKYKGSERAEVQKVNEQKVNDAILRYPILKDRLLQ